MKVYKIVDRTTGLFSSGGGYVVEWCKGGRSFPSKAAVKAHLTQVRKRIGRHSFYPYADAEIREYELEETGRFTMTFEELE